MKWESVISRSLTQRRFLTLYEILLDAIATHRVADRPDRYEPRAWKGYQKKFAYLRKPRAQAKREMAKGPTEILSAIRPPARRVQRLRRRARQTIDRMAPGLAG